MRTFVSVAWCLCIYAEDNDISVDSVMNQFAQRNRKRDFVLQHQTDTDMLVFIIAASEFSLTCGH